MTERVYKVVIVLKIKKAQSGKWIYFEPFTERKVLNEVYCCYLAQKYWYNGGDGFFYSFDKPKEMKNGILKLTKNKAISTERRSLEFITDNMITGYNMQGEIVCHRKRYANDHLSTLRRVMFRNGQV